MCQELWNCQRLSTWVLIFGAEQPTCIATSRNCDGVIRKGCPLFLPWFGGSECCVKCPVMGLLASRQGLNPRCIFLNGFYGLIIDQTTARCAPSPPRDKLFAWIAYRFSQRSEDHHLHKEEWVGKRSG